MRTLVIVVVCAVAVASCGPSPTSPPEVGDEPLQFGSLATSQPTPTAEAAAETAVAPTEAPSEAPSPEPSAVPTGVPTAEPLPPTVVPPTDVPLPPTEAPAPRPEYSDPAADRNCSDFSDGWEAQTWWDYWRARGSNNPGGLDGDNDGNVCESQK